MITRPPPIPTHARAAAVALAVLAVGLAAPSARANGRFPRAERLLEDPSNPDRVLLATTYGLLTTHDRGKTWYHTCEAAFAGSDSYNFDPVLDLVAGGAALVDVQDKINRSTDDCAWTPVLDTNLVAVGYELIQDFSVERAQRKTVVALVSTTVGALTTFQVKESRDGGLTWAAVGAPLPLSIALTIDFDPADPTHLYASGVGLDGSPAFVTSTDHAATWTSRVITGLGQGDYAYIAAVRPGVSGGVFVRTYSTAVVTDGEGGSMNVAADALLYTSDGGMTWTQLLRKWAKLLGFALSPDGATVLAGYGNDDTSPVADPSQLGVFAAKTSDWQFAPVYPGHPVTCLTWTAAGTYVCTGAEAPAALAPVVFFPTGTLAANPPVPQPFFRFHDVVGPPPFCASTSAKCDWTNFCLFFNACPDAGQPSPDAGASLADATLGDSANAGAGPAGFDAADATVDDAVAPDSGAAESSGSSSCSCRAGPARMSAGRGVLSAVALGALARRRRKPPSGGAKA